MSGGYHAGEFFVEGAGVERLATEYGTPCYVYSKNRFIANWRAYAEALARHPHLICYAVKANSNLALLNLLAGLGSGFDIVSVGELERVLAAGGVPGKTVFAGVGKRDDEIARALDAGIRCFNVESVPELERINQIAGAKRARAPVSIRVNPDVDAQTHPYIATGLKQNKFGVAMEAAFALYQHAQRLPHVEIEGVGCHIGSQLTRTAPFVDALTRLKSLVRQLDAAGIALKHIDIGGGLGIRYRDESPPPVPEFCAGVLSVIADLGREILLEPGRSIAGDAGWLLTRIEYVKHSGARSFVVVDAAMNDLLRPALYHAWQPIFPARERPGTETTRVDVVGPVCETGDFLGLDRDLGVAPGDLLVVGAVGAYGFAMSSNYNSRPRAAEVLVDGTVSHLIRRREAIEDLWRGEILLR